MADGQHAARNHPRELCLRIVGRNLPLVAQRARALVRNHVRAVLQNAGVVMPPHALHLLVRREHEPEGVARGPCSGTVIVIESGKPGTHHLGHVLRDLLSSALRDDAVRHVGEVADAAGSVGREARVQAYLQLSAVSA